MPRSVLRVPITGGGGGTERPATRAKILNNVIVLQSSDPIEKIAVSFAFAQSSKLAALEEALDITIEEVNILYMCIYICVCVCLSVCLSVQM